MDSTYFWGSLLGLGFYALAYVVARSIILPRSNGMVTSRHGIFLVLGVGSILLLSSLVYLIYFFPEPFVDAAVL